MTISVDLIKKAAINGLWVGGFSSIFYYLGVSTSISNALFGLVQSAIPFTIQASVVMGIMTFTSVTLYTIIMAWYNSTSSHATGFNGAGL